MSGAVGGSPASGSGAAAGSSAAPPSAAAAAAVSDDGLGDSDIVCDVFVESTWRGRAPRYDREQQSDTLATRDAASQAIDRAAAGVSGSPHACIVCSLTISAAF